MSQIQEPQAIIDAFHQHYYEQGLRAGGTWDSTFWMGIPIFKCPTDLIIYQEIIYELKPDVIIETGTANGGSALFMAHLCDLIGTGRIITVDLATESSNVRVKRPEHERIKYLTGSSIAPEILQQIETSLSSSDRVLVILDSDHHYGHVLQELKLYSRFVTPNSYLIVEDTNINGHPVYPEFGPGPMEAIQEFLKEDKRFIVDREREKLLLTFNPGGFLKRIA